MLAINEKRVIKPILKADNTMDAQDNIVSGQVGVVQHETKPFYQSKTLWFNLLVALFTALTQFVPSLQHVMTAEMYAIVVIVVNLINKALRMYTDKGIQVVKSVKVLPVVDGDGS